MGKAGGRRRRQACVASVVLSLLPVRHMGAGPPRPSREAGRPGGRVAPGFSPPPRGERACWATLGEPSLPLPQFPGSAERRSGGARSAGLLWAWGTLVPSARSAVVVGEVRVCEVLRGCITSVQGLLNKVGVFTCSCNLLSSLKSWIC